MKKTIGLAVLGFILAACGGGGGSSGGGNTTLACNLQAQGGCFEWSGPESSIGTVQTAFNQACSSEGGSAVSACPSANRVGKCTLVVTQGTISVTIVTSLYSPTYTATTAQQECTSSGGTWSN